MRVRRRNYVTRKSHGAYKGAGSSAASITVAMAEEGDESPLAASEHNVRPRPTLEWLKRAKNGWMLRETIAITKISIPMVRLLHFSFLPEICLVFLIDSYKLLLPNNVYNSSRVCGTYLGAESGA